MDDLFNRLSFPFLFLQNLAVLKAGDFRYALSLKKKYQQVPTSKFTLIILTTLTWLLSFPHRPPNQTKTAKTRSPRKWPFTTTAWLPRDSPPWILVQSWQRWWQTKANILTSENGQKKFHLDMFFAFTKNRRSGDIEQLQKKASWWFQPLWKISVKLEIFPK